MCLCVLCIRAVTTFENASCNGPPARAPSAPQCTADTTTHLHCLRHHSTSTDQVRVKFISFTSAFTSFRWHPGATTLTNGSSMLVCVCVFENVCGIAVGYLPFWGLSLFSLSFSFSCFAHFAIPCLFLSRPSSHTLFSPSSSVWAPDRNAEALLLFAL